MKQKYSIITLVALLAVTSCTDLDVTPKSSATNNVVFNNPATYYQFLARVYAGLAMSGQQGPAGNADIKGIDEGFSNYLRQYWKAQELPTDEAVIGWNDGTLPTYHLHTWTAQNEFINAMFNRIYFQVSMANEFLRETTDAKLTERNTTDALRAEIQVYRAEARFMRALSYWHAIDMFGSVPLVLEDATISTTNSAPQVTRQELFDFIETELLTIEHELVPARQNQYGRADQATAWMVLAKLYLNAEVYTGQKKYTECITYCKKIIDAGYVLDESYETLFMIDNETSEEVIFSVNFDGNNTQTYGGMTFLIHAAIGGSMDPESYGMNSGWSGLRATKNLVNLFPDATGDLDSRAIFYTDGQSKEITEIIDKFTDGYAVPKFKNVTSDGDIGASLEFADTDFPMFRLGDVYLMYAEAVERGGTGGSEADAVAYINALRERAYGDASGNISASDITLDFLIDERGRELYWEAHRRTDLIRFGLFSDSESNNPRAVWPWKGSVPAGAETESFRDLFPLPSAQIIANPKLKQHDGYN